MNTLEQAPQIPNLIPESQPNMVADVVFEQVQSVSIGDRLRQSRVAKPLAKAAIFATGTLSVLAPTATAQETTTDPYTDYELEGMCVESMERFGEEHGAKSKVNKKRIFKYSIPADHMKPLDEDYEVVPGVNCQSFGDMRVSVYATYDPIAKKGYRLATKPISYPQVETLSHLEGKAKVGKGWRPVITVPGHEIEVPLDTTVKYSYESYAYPEHNSTTALKFATTVKAKK